MARQRIEMTKPCFVCHPRVVDDDAPSWDALRRRVASGRFSTAGVSALELVLGGLERLLGRSWPRRQYERCGWWPSEFNLLGFHAAVLPQFLALALRLEAAAIEPTFGAVPRGMKRGVTRDGWRHALLQLEVGRALRDTDTTITYEPEISGSASRADLLVARSDGSSFLVETTTLARPPVDLEREEAEHYIWQAVTALEMRWDVRIAVQMLERRGGVETRRWLDAVEDAARSHSAGDLRVVESVVGRAEIRPAGSSVPELAFVGETVTRDSWYRLGRTVRAKARQSAGPLPVWLRVDALDGFFQFTDWARLDWTERIDRVATALRRDLAGPGAEHLAGVVLSSSSAVLPGATDPAVEDQTMHSERGSGLRRLVSDHLVRETAIIGFHDNAATEQRSWAAAYSTEQDWLQQDLSRHAFPQIGAFLAD